MLTLICANAGAAAVPAAINIDSNRLRTVLIRFMIHSIFG